MKKILALIAALSLVTLTACGNSNAAATLGKTTISQSQLQATVDTILKEREGVDVSQMQLESGATLVRNQLQFQLLLTGFAEIAKELDIQITNSEVAARRGQIVEQVGGIDVQLERFALQVARTQNAILIQVTRR